MTPVYHTSQIITISNFWSIEKCNHHINKSEKIGYGPALIQTRFGQQRVDSVRNNERVIKDDFELANSIWKQLSIYAPSKIGNSVAIGLNERFRYYKYSEGQIFKKHRDQSFIRNSKESSYFTFMIYLNDEFEGGETTFPNLEIRPETGKCLLFYHPIEHEGSEVMSGNKYILRSDIMYRIENNA